MFKENFGENLMQIFPPDSNRCTVTDFSEFAGKNVAFISPHPDDAEICCGATIYQLNKVGCSVYDIVGVSGTNSVKQNDLLTLKRCIYNLGLDLQGYDDLSLKRMIRESECINAFRCLGVPESNVHFLRLSIYNNKSPDYDSDVNKIQDTLESLHPDILFVCADHDPHGTHGQVLELTKEAVSRISFKPRIFLYFGAWNEFPSESFTTMYPFSEFEEGIKKQSICCHTSQLNPMFPGSDSREFYQRAEDLSYKLAKDANYKRGSNHFAIEAFCEVPEIPSVNLNIIDQLLTAVSV